MLLLLLQSKPCTHSGAQGCCSHPARTATLDRIAEDLPGMHKGKTREGGGQARGFSETRRHTVGYSPSKYAMRSDTTATLRLFPNS